MRRTGLGAAVGVVCIASFTLAADSPLTGPLASLPPAYKSTGSCPGESLAYRASRENIVTPDVSAALFSLQKDFFAPSFAVDPRTGLIRWGEIGYNCRMDWLMGAEFDFSNAHTRSPLATRVGATTAPSNGIAFDGR
jgi:hypothetical protein